MRRVASDTIDPQPTDHIFGKLVQLPELAFADMQQISIETLERCDVPAALDLQATIYPTSLLEGEDAFLSRISFSASYCLGAKQEGQLVGYLIAHGWKHRSPPPLGASLAHNAPIEILFLHDLAVSPLKRSLRVGQSLVNRAFEMARRDGLLTAELVAVEGAANFWHRIGFVETAAATDVQQKLRTYGNTARWMTREL